MDTRPLLAAATLLGSALLESRRVLIHCDADADGVTSAVQLALLLKKSRIPHTVEISREKKLGDYTHLFSGTHDAVVILDKGSGYAFELDKMASSSGKELFIIDHHNPSTTPPTKHTHILNPRQLDLDGSRHACSSTSVSAILRSANSSLYGHAAWMGLVGAIGDWQHRDGWHGWNRELLEELVGVGTLTPRSMPAVVGINMAEALARRLGVSIHESSKLLADSKIRNLSDVEDMTHLEQAALLKILKENIEGKVERTEYFTAGKSIRQWYRLVDSAVREGSQETAFEALIEALEQGAGPAINRANSCYEAYRTKIMDGIQSLIIESAKPDNPVVMEVTDPNYTGMIAGIGRSNVLGKHDPRVVLTHAVRPDGSIQVSSRGTHQMVAEGLDLGAIFAKCGAACDGEGGGHPIAAGIVLHPTQLGSFVELVREELAKLARTQP